MFDIGFTEMLVIAIIGMVVIGPERLPGAARTVGRSVGQLRRFLSNLQNQLEQEVKLDELNKKIMEETKGQTFRNNDEPEYKPSRSTEPEGGKASAASSHQSEDAEVPTNSPEGPEGRHRPSEPSKSEETAEQDEVRKP